jgi:hypothetical protein
MLRSSVMNLFISFFALLIGPKKALNSMKYQLEAIKWSLKASNYYCYEDSALLSKIVQRFVSFEKPNKQSKADNFYQRFLELRQNPSDDLKFMIRTPIRILNIHVKAILFRKLTKKKIRKKPLKSKKQVPEPRYFPLTY